MVSQVNRQLFVRRSVSINIKDTTFIFCAFNGVFFSSPSQGTGVHPRSIVILEFIQLTPGIRHLSANTLKPCDRAARKRRVSASKFIFTKEFICRISFITIFLINCSGLLSKFIISSGMACTSLHMRKHSASSLQTRVSLTNGSGCFPFIITGNISAHISLTSLWIIKSSWSLRQSGRSIRLCSLKPSTISSCQGCRLHIS
jgi:hypothetical protein